MTAESLQKIEKALRAAIGTHGDTCKFPDVCCVVSDGREALELLKIALAQPDDREGEAPALRDKELL